MYTISTHVFELLSPYPNRLLTKLDDLSILYSLILLWTQVPVVVRCRRDRAPGQVGQVGAHDAGLQEGRHQASRALVGAREHCQTEDEQGQRPVA